MMAESTLECDNCYECFLVVVDSGGVVGAMDGFLYAALPAWSCSARRSPNTAGKARAGRASKLRRALVKQKSKTAKVLLPSLLRASCFTQ